MTGCGTAPGGLPGQMTGEASAEGAAESLPEISDDVVEGSFKAPEASSEASRASSEVPEGSFEAPEKSSEVSKASSEVLEADEGDSEKIGARLTFSLGGDASTAGVPQEILEQVEAINGGEPPASAVGMDELEGYYALIATHTIIGKDAETGEEVTGRGKLTFYVPNLLEGLADVSALFYDRAAGQWEVLPVEQDTEAKTVSVMLPGSGILTVIYRRQG